MLRSVTESGAGGAVQVGARRGLTGPPGACLPG
ncbi:hypothetical protein Ae406Ps2_6392 [Pseudonocardia sp. Ae406_Ps2]|nr:hypothetical protein Ae406Ps2_6392 [Pseudonocardia sp. Ae406_Ps2]